MSAKVVDMEETQEVPVQVYLDLGNGQSVSVRKMPCEMERKYTSRMVVLDPTSGNQLLVEFDDFVPGGFIVGTLLTAFEVLNGRKEDDDVMSALYERYGARPDIVKSSLIMLPGNRVGH